MNPAYLIATLGSAFYGAGDFLGGLGARRASALVVTFFSGIAALLVLIPMLPVASGALRAPDMAWGAAAGVCGAFGATLIYRALGIGPMSVASPVLCIVALALPVVVGLALGERPSALAAAGVLLIPLAVTLLARGHDDPGTKGHARSVLWPSIQAGLAAGCFLVCMGRVAPGAALWPLIASRSVSLLLLGLLLLTRSAPFVPPPGARVVSLGAGALDSFANLAYVLAVQRGSLALVAALVSLAPAVSVLLARAFLHERWSPSQAWGLGLALVAGVCISIG